MKRYPDEIKKFIESNVKGRTTRELTAMLNDRFNDSGFYFTESKVKAYKGNHNIKSGTTPGVRQGTTTKFPQEMMEYVKENARGIGNQEMADRCNELFGTSVTAVQMRNFKRNHKISSGLTGRFEKGHVPATKGKKMPSHPNSQKTQFKKGHIPHNHAEVGTLRHTTDGYLVRKIGEPNQWELEARLVYEREKGEIPEGKVVTYLDGNKDNVSIDNLALITCNVNLELNRKKYRFQNPELTQSGILAAQLAVDIRKRKGTT